MKSELSSVDLIYIVKEMGCLVDGRVDKIYQSGKEEFFFQFFVPKLGKKIVRITDKLFYFIESKKETKEPPEFCMYLRKKLGNAWIKSVKQIETERIVEFLFEVKNGKLKLVIELFGGGNLILTDENDIILTASKYKKFKDREIMPKKKYSCPKRDYNFKDLKNDELVTMFESSEKENIVKSLAIDLGLGGVYAEEVCYISKVSKDEPTESVSDDIINKLIKAIKKIVDSKIKGFVVYDKKKATDFTPFKLKYYEDKDMKEFSTFNEAVLFYFTEEFKDERKVKSDKDKKIEKLQRIIEEQKRMMKGMEKSEKENREKAELIYSNYQLINEVLLEIKKARKKFSWEEIEEKLKGHKLIKNVNSKEKRIVVDV